MARFLAAVALSAGGALAQETRTSTSARPRWRTSCAAWCARTRRSPIPTRRSRSTCATRSASSSPGGASEREVLDFMVARYGDFVLYRPPLKASTVVLWARAVPAAGAGPVLLLRRLRRARVRRSPRSPTPSARAPRSCSNDRCSGSSARRSPRLALALVLRPLLLSAARRRRSRRDDANVSIYRDQLRELDADLAAGTLAQADYERARAELEARLLEDVARRRPRAAPRRAARRRLALVLGARDPAAALRRSTSRSAIPRAIRASTRADAQQIEAMVERLAARLRENPDDARRLEAARPLLRRARALPRGGGRLRQGGGARAARRRSCSPTSPTRSPWRAASAWRASPRSWCCARSRSTRATSRRSRSPAPRPSSAATTRGAGATGSACCRWCRPTPRTRASIRGNIDEAQGCRAAAAARALRGTVSLSREAEGAGRARRHGVHLRARRRRARRCRSRCCASRCATCRCEFALDDSMAMAPGHAPVGASRAWSSARASRSPATPTPQPGDLQGASAPVANDARGVSVVIDSRECCA